MACRVRSAVAWQAVCGRPCVAGRVWSARAWPARAKRGGAGRGRAHCGLACGPRPVSKNHAKRTPLSPYAARVLVFRWSIARPATVGHRSRAAAGRALVPRLVELEAGLGDDPTGFDGRGQGLVVELVLLGVRAS